MPRWVKVSVLLVGMLGWLVMVIGSLWLRQMPSAFVVGFPAGLWMAVSRADSLARKRASRGPHRAAVKAAADKTKGDLA